MRSHSSSPSQGEQQHDPPFDEYRPPRTEAELRAAARKVVGTHVRKLAREKGLERCAWAWRQLDGSSVTSPAEGLARTAAANVFARACKSYDPGQEAMFTTWWTRLAGYEVSDLLTEAYKIADRRRRESSLDDPSARPGLDKRAFPVEAGRPVEDEALAMLEREVAIRRGRKIEELVALLPTGEREAVEAHMRFWGEERSLINAAADRCVSRETQRNDFRRAQRKLQAWLQDLEVRDDA